VCMSRASEWRRTRVARDTVAILPVRILVIPITRSGFIRSPDLPNAMG